MSLLIKGMGIHIVNLCLVSIRVSISRGMIYITLTVQPEWHRYSGTCHDGKLSAMLMIIIIRVDIINYNYPNDTYVTDWRCTGLPHSDGDC